MANDGKLDNSENKAKDHHSDATDKMQQEFLTEQSLVGEAKNIATDGRLGNSENKITTQQPDATEKLQQEFLTADCPKSNQRIGEKAAGMVNDFHTSILADDSRKTNFSFDTAVAKGVALGKEDEIALELDMRDVLNAKTEQPLLRTKAIMAAALGEFRLDSGTRLDVASHADTKERILQGLNYDFTGEATTFLRLAAGTLQDAQKEVEAHYGEVINGQPMNDDYKKQLHDEQLKVETKLDQIYGSHDIPAVFNELEIVASNYATAPDLSKAILHMSSEFKTNPSSDNRQNGKRARDLAVGFLAEASKYSKLNPYGEDAKIMYKTSLQFLAESERISDSKDNQALRELAVKVGRNIPTIADEAIKASNDSYLAKVKEKH